MATKVDSAPVSRLTATSPDVTIQGLKKTSDGMRRHIAKLKAELEMEKSKYRKLKRERVMDVRTVRDQEQQRTMAAISELKTKFHQEKINELLAQKETLTKQFENEIKKMVRQKEDALGKMQTELLKTKEEFLMKMKNKIAADAQEETKKKFEGERTRLLQEINELKEGKKKVEISLCDAKEADRKRSTEMKWKHDKHLLEVDQLKKDARRDIVRLVDELKKKNKVISELQKEVGQQSGQSKKLQAEKDSLKGELQTLVKMAETWEKSSPSPRQIPSPRPDALGRLSPDSQALEDFERERFHRKLTELIAFIRRLEIVNETLLKDKAVLESKLKNSDFTSERYKLAKQIQDLEHDKKRLEDRCKFLNEDNNKLRGSRIPIRRQDAQHPRKSPTVEINGRLSKNSSDDQSEVEQLKKQADDHFKTITELKQQIIERDRRLDLIQHRRRRARRRQPAILESPKGQEDETGIDSASIASSISQMSDNTLSGEWDELERAELEGNYQQLSKEYLQLKKAYARLQAMIGGSLDVQRECKLRQQLELDLLDSQARIEDLNNIVHEQGKDSGWVEEKQKLIMLNRKLQEKIKDQEENINKVKFDLRDSKDQNELLEFRILELEERMETAHSVTPESLSSLSSESPEKLVKRSDSPTTSVLPEIEVAESDGNALQIAVTEEGFTGMSVSEIKKKLEKMGSLQEQDRLSVEEKKTLVRARAMLDIADLKLKKMTAMESSLKRKTMDLEHEKDRLAAKICSLEAELRNKLSELEESNKRVDELEDIIQKMKRSEAKFRAQEDVYLNNESKLCDEITTLKKQMASAREGRNYENELLFQKIAEVKQEKEPETPQKVTALEKENSKLQEKLDRLLKDQTTMASEEGAEIKSKKIELSNIMTLEELDYLKNKVQQIQEAELKIAKMEQTELALKEHIDELEQEVAELQQHVHRSKEKQNEVVEDYEEREVQLKDKIKKVKQEKGELKEELQKILSGESNIEMENKKLQRRVDELEKSETSLKEKVDELEKELTSLRDAREAEAATQDEEIARIKAAAIETSKNALSDLESELKMIKEENHELIDKLTVFEFSEKALKELINQLRSDNELLKDQTSVLQSENEKLKNALPTESATDGTDMDKEDAKNEILKLRDRVWELENSEKSLESDVKELRAENQNLLAKLKKLPVESSDKVTKQQVNYLSLTDADKEELLEPIQDMANNETVGHAVEDLRASQDTKTSEKEDLLTMYKEALEKIQEYENGGRESADISKEEAMMRVSTPAVEEAVVRESAECTQEGLLQRSSFEDPDVQEALMTLREDASDEELDSAIDVDAKEGQCAKIFVEEELILKETIRNESEAAFGGTFVMEEPTQHGTFNVSESGVQMATEAEKAQRTTGTQFPDEDEISSEKPVAEQQSLEVKISELQASRDELTQDLNDLKSSEDVLRKENENLTSEVSELRNAITAVEEKSKALEEELKNKESVLHEQKLAIEEQEKIKTEKERDTSVKLQEVSERLKLAEEQCAEKDQTIKEVQTSQAELKEEIAEVAAEKEEIEQKLLEARQQLEENETMLGNLRESESNLTEQLGEMMAERETLLEDLKDGNDTLKEKELTLESLKAESEELSRKIDVLSARRDELLHQLKEATSSVEEKRAKEDELQNIISELQGQEASLKEKLAEVEKSQKTSEAKVSELEESERQYKGKIAELESSEKVLKERVAELESLDEALQENEAELEDSRTSLNESERRADELAAQEQILKCKMSELDDRIVILEGSEESFKMKVEDLEQELEERKSIDSDLKEEHLKEVAALQEQIKHFEESQEAWNEQERSLKNRVEELEENTRGQEDRFKELQQTESALKGEVKKQEEYRLKVRRESEDMGKTLEGRITKLTESEALLQEKVSQLTSSENNLRKEFAEASKSWKRNEEVLKEKVKSCEETEDALKSRLSTAEEREIEVQEQLEAKVRESEVSAEIWQQSENALSERVAELEESEGTLKGEVEELRKREQEMNEQLAKMAKESENTLESSIFLYKAKLQELEESENILKEKMAQVIEAENNARDMLQEANAVYRQNEESLKERIENLEEEQGEMQGKVHELESYRNSLMGQVEDEEKKVKELRKEKRVLEERQDELEDEVYCLKEKLNKSERLLEEAERVDKESQTQLLQQIETLQYERRSNEKNLNDKIRELEEIENKNQNKVYELEAAKSLLEDQVQSLEGENKRSRGDMRDLNDKISDLEDETCDLRRKAKDAEEKAEELEKTECELRDKLREKDKVEEERKMKFEETLEDMKKRINELEMSEEIMRDEVEHMEKTGQKLKLKVAEKNEDIDRILQQRKKEKDELRKKIQDQEEVEMQLKEQVYLLGLDVKKKEWDMERIEPHIKFQSLQIQDASRQEIRSKELTNTLRKRIEQLENRERDLKTQLTLQEDSQAMLMERAAKGEKREKELCAKVDKMQKCEEDLKSEISALKNQEGRAQNREIETLKDKLQALEGDKEDLRNEIARSEKNENKLQKLLKTLEEDFAYLQDREKKEQEKVKQLEKEHEQLKKSAEAEKQQYEEKVGTLETAEKTLQKKLTDAKQVEKTLQKEMSTAEERHDKMEGVLKQTNKALERKNKDLEDSEQVLKQRVQDLEKEENNLKQKLKKLENSESTLRKEVSDFENDIIDLRHNMRELESGERMLKMDNDQLTLEKDLLNEKVAELKESQRSLQAKVEEMQKNESKLKEDIQELEKKGNAFRDKIREMESNAAALERRSAEAAELEKDFTNIQQELQEANMKVDQLERTKASLKRQLENLEDDLATGQMISIPLEEFKRMKAQTALLEMTEQNVEELQKAEAKLKDKLRQVEAQKDYTDADKEILEMRCRLEEKDKEIGKLNEKYDEAQLHLKTAQRQVTDLRSNHTGVRRELKDLQESLEKGDILNSIYTKRTSKFTQTDALRYLCGEAMQSTVFTPQNKQITLAQFVEALPYNSQVPKLGSISQKSVRSQRQWENGIDRVIINTDQGLVDANVTPVYRQSVCLQMQKTADLGRSRTIHQLVENLPQSKSSDQDVKTRPAQKSHGLYSIREDIQRKTIPDRTRAPPRGLDTAGPHERKKLIEGLIANLPGEDKVYALKQDKVESVPFRDLADEQEIVSQTLYYADSNSDVSQEAPSMPSSMHPSFHFQSHSKSLSSDSDVPPPLPSTPIPTQVERMVDSQSDSESDYSDVELPPLPSSDPPKISDLVLDRSGKQATLHLRKPPSFDSGMDSQSTGTDRDYVENSENSVFAFPDTGKPLTLPKTPLSEPPEVLPKPPTPLWIQKMVQRRKSEKDLYTAETEQLKGEISRLRAESEEREAVLREREIAARIQEIEDIGELKCKLQETEEAVKEKANLCRSLRVENTQLHSEFREKNSQITALKAEVMRLERLLKVNKTDEDIVGQLREELEQVQQQLSQREEDIKSMDDSNIMYKTKLDRREKELASKEEELGEKITELQRLRQQMSSLEQTNRMQQVEADTKYSELAGKYEALKRELQTKSMELDDTTQELARLEEHLAELRNKLKGVENLQSERDILHGKLQAAESALRQKTDQERDLFQEVASLQSKVTEYEKLNATRDGLEENYRDIKLRAKVSRLVKKCKERDAVIKRLAAELREQYGGRTSELLDAVCRLQSRMPDEEYNEPLTPYSTSLVGINEEPEVVVGRQEIRVESSSRSSPMAEPVRGTPNLSESAINELSEPLWQAIESSSPAPVRPSASQNSGSQLSDEAAMQELLQSLSTDMGDLTSGGASGRSSSRSRMSPGSALQDLLSADPELARMLERGASGRDSASTIGDYSDELSNVMAGRVTPRQQRQRDGAHLSQGSGNILNMADRSHDPTSGQFSLNYEPSPLLAEEANRLAEQLNGTSKSFTNGLPRSPLLTNLSVMPQSSLSQGGHLSLPPMHLGNSPSAFARLPNGDMPFMGNGSSPAHLGGVDMPDLANLSIGSSSTAVSPNGTLHHLMLHPSSLPVEGPPQPPSDFRISRVVSSRSILLAWTPPPLDEMAKSNGAQVAGYKIYLNERQKQLVNSAHLTKALIENINVRNPMAFSIETVTVTGQTSRRVDTYHSGSVTSPHPTESTYSDSVADTEVSSILSDMSEPRKRTFIAIYSYNPMEHSPNDYPSFELSFKEGDIISVYGTVRSDGFFHGKLRGRKGLVPSNFVEEIHVTESKSHRKKKSRSQGSLQNGHSSTPSDTPRQRSARSSRPSSGKTSRSGSKV